MSSISVRVTIALSDCMATVNKLKSVNYREKERERVKIVNAYFLFFFLLLFKFLLKCMYIYNYKKIEIIKKYISMVTLKC